MAEGWRADATRIGTSADRDVRDRLQRRRSVRHDPALWWAACAGAGWLALYALLTGVGHGDPELARLVGDVVYLAPISAAVFLAAVAARRAEGRMARMWRLLTASNVAWLIGEAIWAGYSFLSPGGVPFPSVADLSYLVSYAFAIPAILIGFGGAGSLRQLRGVLDAGLVVLAIGALGWQFLIGPQVSGQGPESAVLVSAAYPLLDLALVACLVAVGMAGHRMVPYSVLLTGGAFAAWAVTDAGYIYLVTVTEYSSGSWLNLGWQVSAVLLCLAALVTIRHRESDATVEQLDRDLTLVPVLMAALATFLLVVVDDLGGDVSRSTLIVAAVMLAGLVLRQFLFTRDRTRLAADLQVALREQERLAVTDGLTGLYNRRFLLEMLKLEADRAARARAPLSLAVIDLDHFKQINDVHGHPVGDLVLMQAADRIRQMARGRDIVARYGGEEFVVLLPDTDDEVALELAERIRLALRRAPVSLARAREITVTGSVGVATALADPATGRLDTERLVADADRALYRAKAEGRDRTAVAGGRPGTRTDRYPLPPALLWLADRIDAALGTHEHSTAVQRWCRLLGERIGLDDDAVARAAAAGRLHDIGKVAVNAAILGKPGRLDQDEWAQLRRHCAEGGRLLRDMAECVELAPLVEAHHERYDGGGYPYGLAGASIPVEARIIAVCDSWAAMRVDRAYASAKTVEEARRELIRGRGTQFDPLLVDAFLQMVDEGVVDDPQPLPRNPAPAADRKLGHRV